MNICTTQLNLKYLRNSGHSNKIESSGSTIKCQILFTFYHIYCEQYAPVRQTPQQSGVDDHWNEAECSDAVSPASSLCPCVDLFATHLNDQSINHICRLTLYCRMLQHCKEMDMKNRASYAMTENKLTGAENAFTALSWHICFCSSGFYIPSYNSARPKITSEVTATVQVCR